MSDKQETEKRIEELESRIDELEGQVDELEGEKGDLELLHERCSTMVSLFKEHWSKDPFYMQNEDKLEECIGMILKIEELL
jgi:hypothetical protein